MSQFAARTRNLDGSLSPAEMQSEALRQYYRDHTDASRANAARTGLWLAVCVYLLFSIPDYILIADVAGATIKARFIVGLSFLAVIELLSKAKARARFLEVTCALALVFGYLFWLVPASQTVHAEDFKLYMVFGSIFMMGANLFFSFFIMLSVATSVAVLLIFFATIFYLYPADQTYIFVFGLFYVSCLIFTSYVNWKLNEERYNVFLNAMEAAHQHKQSELRGSALEELSNTDYLTGVENRRAIERRLREKWNDWQKDGQVFCAILVDVDFFKRYNDFYGHQAGDRCLILVAKALQTSLEPLKATVGRFGGEEFIVVAHVTGREQTAALAEEIRKTIEALTLVHSNRRDGQENVTVSVGASFTRPHSVFKLERLIDEADRALYSAKQNGRNCVRVFDPADPLTSDENENIAATLRIAVKNDLVSMAYQPIINMRTKQLEGVEALMRLKMADGTPLMPSQFIPVAERTGAIIELGLWAIRRVCEDVLVPGHAPLATVNVSATQLMSRGFALAVSTILDETGVSGEQLAFEITEGIDMAGQSDVIRCITALKAHGIRIWLDDFGTGFAGLSWLRLFPFDTVKIDRSFLSDTRGPAGRAMLEDIIRLIRNRGLKILIEGVETKDHTELMEELGIELGQGYFLGRPGPVADLVRVQTVRKARVARP
ncbi:putative bifunctional diguanylate cyclase/phosphodiesterase [Peteryoungia ipomoeae]|uniref:Bifunctional diguanylate cyclase/phosphodiesterase n=1 Tax=Peteryoungia ipomoeae TaxID=1210932 RepID=A0A4S8P5X7_9HYPH|nr:EAL domain-containing protein [Peteryoungia ipomoeae]THV25633.1 bifunctional diguanylate cyclase/phosphodiesterase [Peteryoungia ipomoeae]